jgi:hypothetical protein
LFHFFIGEAKRADPDRLVLALTLGISLIELAVA